MANGNELTKEESIYVELSGGVTITAADIKNYFCPKATEKEVFMALGVCKSLGLNPHTREVHFIKYADSPMQIVTGYDVYIKRAERSGKLNGWRASIDGDIARVIIYRKDWTEPFVWEVSTKEFNKNQSTWKVMPSFMAKKVAISQGFRLCFPEELGGLPYTTDEQAVYFDKPQYASGKPVVKEPQAIKEPADIQEPPIDNIVGDDDAIEPSETPKEAKKASPLRVLAAINMSVGKTVPAISGIVEQVSVGKTKGGAEFTDVVIKDAIGGDATMEIKLIDNHSDAVYQTKECIFYEVRITQNKTGKKFFIAENCEQRGA